MKKYILFLMIIMVGASSAIYAKIVVESTQGEVAYKKDKIWEPLTKGMELQEGVKISTGAKSWALINIDGDSLKVQQMTMMKIYRNI